MQIHYLSQENSILNHFLAQIRDTEIQKDRLRFRRNMERIGEIMAYELSKTLIYKSISVTTPLGIKETTQMEDALVLCSILRAGIPLHFGFLNYFDQSENGFISAFRKHLDNSSTFEIIVEYQAMPSIQDKTLLVIDPMLATGQSMVAVCKTLLKTESPKEIHIAAVVATPEGISLLQEQLPPQCHLWIASLDTSLNPKKYIVPGLGDAGDLAFGPKL